MRSFRLVTLAAATVVLASCGIIDSDGVAQPVDTTPATTVGAVAAQPVAAIDQPCPVEAEFLRSLVVAYTAKFGVAPTSEADFLARGLMDIDLRGVDLGPDGVVATGAQCEMPGSAVVFADVPADCAEELDRLIIDGYVSKVFGGDGPDFGVANALGVDHGPFVLYQPDMSTLTPLTPGCPNGDQLQSAGEADTCEVERVTLETALETYEAVHGESPANETVLVDDGLLQHETHGWDLVIDANGVAQVQPTQLGPCAA